MKKRFLPAILIGFIFYATSCAGPSIIKPEPIGSKMPDPDTIASPPIDFDPPCAERIELDNGMVLFFMEDRELPIVNMTFVTRAGSVFDPLGLEGLAAMTASVMRSGGTLNLSADEVDDELDFLGAEIFASVTPEYLTFSLNSTVETFDGAFRLFVDILNHPRFCDQRLATSKGVTLEELTRIQDDPQRLAFREISRLIHEDEAWGRQPSPATVGAIERSHLVTFHERHIKRGPAMITVAGAVKASEITRQLNDLFGSRSLEESDPLPPPPIPRRSSASYYLAKRLPQSVIIAGHSAPGKKSGDYYAMEVLDTIVGGGGFQSRMMTEIRTRRGLAYSAGSIYLSRSGHGVFTAYAVTRSEATVTVVDLTESILQEMVRNPVEEKTLDQARKALTNSYVFSFTSPRMIVERWMINEFLGLPPDFLYTYIDRINAVTAEDVRRVAETVLKDDRRVLFVLGDPAFFKGELSQRGPLSEVRSDLLNKALDGKDDD